MHKYVLKRVDNKQYVVMLVDCIFVNETILPSVREQLSVCKYRRIICDPELPNDFKIGTVPSPHPRIGRATRAS